MMKAPVDSVRKQFKPDLLLVAESAKEHRIPVTSGDIFVLPVPGANNLRLPKNNEQEVYKLFLGSPIIVIACIDSRLSAEAVNATSADAWVLVAGGATQPDENRMSNLVSYVSTIYSANKDANFVLLGHNKVCKLLNLATDGQVANMSADEE